MRCVVLAVLLMSASPGLARDSLGTYEGWGAFRDAQPYRCFAIAEPLRSSNRDARPFATISYWPGDGVRGQLHVRLSRETRPAARVVLSVDDKHINLIASGADAWASGPRADASIIAAMRSGRVLSITTIAANGNSFTDSYRLKGAATAIDAAALGCAKGR